MYGEDVAIIAIIFGSILSIVFLGIVGSIIKSWINRGSKSSDITKNKEFLAALREFKEKTEKRLNNLEAIVTDEIPDKRVTENKGRKKQEQKSAIEIEMDNREADSDAKESGKLRNMLNQ
ncbi:MAG: hypothetical protein WD735_06455 [Balneolaceae bacterium]